MGSRLAYLLGVCIIAVLPTWSLCEGPGVSTSHADTTQAAPADSVLLEIVREIGGMVPYQGKWMYFRFYRSGRAEYEELTTSQHDRQMRPVKHDLQLSVEDRQRIIKLIQAQDFLNARERYKELWRGIDTVFITTISSNDGKRYKHITLVNFDIEAKNYYPEAVVSLMRTIERLLKIDR